VRVGRLLEGMQRTRDEVARGNERLALLQLEADKAGMDVLRSELDGMIADAQRLLAARTAAARRAEQLTSAAIFAGGGLGLLGGILAALIFARRIARRVRRLESEARDVAAGRPILHEVRGNDEIARLERTLKETSELLASRAAELDKIHSELNSRVDAAVEEREAVFRSSPLALWAVDLDGKVLLWNPAAERIFGWSAEEGVGRPLPVIP
jgi:PAS domain-containing protein